VLIVLFLLLVLVPFGVLWYGVSAKPVYWRPIDGTQANVREAAERFEQAASSQLSQLSSQRDQQDSDQRAQGDQRDQRGGQPVWTMEVTQEQLNNWLAARLPGWGANRRIDPRLLDRISHSMVSIDLDGVEVAVPLERVGVTSIIRLRYKPVVADDKHVRLVLQDAHAGLVPLPIRTVLEGIIAYMPQGRKGELDTLRGQVQSLDLLVPLQDGRTVSLAGMELLPGKLVLTCQVHRG
jgi:hypothetical protein